MRREWSIKGEGGLYKNLKIPALPPNRREWRNIPLYNLFNKKEKRSTIRGENIKNTKTDKKLLLTYVKQRKVREASASSSLSPEINIKSKKVKLFAKHFFACHEEEISTRQMVNMRACLKRRLVYEALKPHGRN